eukprot:c23169_g1_i2 orf=216-923(+)
MASSEIAVKFLVNRRTKAVLYMEAGKDFVDLLYSFLLLPAGTLMQLMSKDGKSRGGGRYGKNRGVGSICNLYNSVEQLHDTTFLVSKSTLLHPQPASNRLLLEGVGKTEPIISANIMYQCTTSRCHTVTALSGSRCPECGYSMSRQLSVVGQSPEVADNSKGFVKEGSSFIITDDLSILPLSTIESIVLLNKLKVQNMADLESSSATVGSKEALLLLEAAFTSKTVLNDVFAHNL